MFSKFREAREKRREEQEQQRLKEERNKWLTVPIERRHNLAFDPPPSFEELANRAIQRAGSDVEYDPDTVAAHFASLWLNLATEAMRGSPDSRLQNAAHGLRVIRERDDFKRRMLWDYLTMQDTAGWAVILFLAEELQSDVVIGRVAGKIRRGELA